MLVKAWSGRGNEGHVLRRAGKGPRAEQCQHRYLYDVDLRMKAFYGRKPKKASS